MSTVSPLHEPAERARYKALAAEIARHNRLYHDEAAPEISDRDFDVLLEQLRAMEAEHPEWVSPESPTQRIGGAPSRGFATVRHRTPMRSIDNTYSEADLRAFDARVRKGLDGEAPAYVVELKLDGIAVALRYEAGSLRRAATRGDGVEGDDITQNAATIPEVVERLPANAPEHLEVRGEVLMRNAELARINAEREARGEEPYRNPRNTTAGTLKLLDPETVRARRLAFFAYEIVPDEGVDIAFHAETLEALARYGFSVEPHYTHCADIDAAIAACNDWRERRFELGYETDGMVVKVDSWEQRRRLGATSKAPRWVMAFKFPAEVAQTRLLDIQVQVGKSGALTPVAYMAPIRLAGTEVKRASLHNFEDLSRKDVRVGDLIEVQKAGEIIPQVLRSVPEARPGGAVPFPLPRVCPACNSKVYKDPEGVYLRCLNLQCPAQVRERLQHFASRKALDIDGMGPAVIEQLVERDWVHSPADFYRVDQAQLETLDRLGAKSAGNLAAAIDRSKAQPLSRVLFGLNIRHVGARTAEILAEHFGDVDGLLDATPEVLQRIPEIGPIMAESIYDFFHTEQNRRLIEALRDAGLPLTEPKRAAPSKAPGSAPFDGKTFVVTGTLARYSREAIEARIKALGGKAASSVSKKTSYVVYGEKAGSKLEKAQRLGIPVLTEDEFEALAEGGA